MISEKKTVFLFAGRNVATKMSSKTTYASEYHLELDDAHLA